MARLDRGSKAILKTLERPARRSSVFQWMVKHHDRIIATAAGGSISWPRLCAEMATHGLNDNSGKPPSLANAKKTWQRVQKKVAATRASEAAIPQKPVYPSRMDKDWRPANAPPPGQASSLVRAVRAPADQQNKLSHIRAAMPQEFEPYDPDKEMDRLRRIMAERSGRTWRE